MVNNDHTGYATGARPPQNPADTISDELDLVELWHTLSRGKWVITFVFLACMASALVYLWTVPSKYQTRAYLLPPSIHNIEELNIPDIVGDNQYTPERVYQVFLQNLQSRDLRRRFFDDHGLAGPLSGNNQDTSTDRVFEKEFNEKLTLEPVSNRNREGTSHTLGLVWKNPRQIAAWVNDYVATVMNHTRDAVTNEVKTLKQNRLRHLDKAIASKRTLGVETKKDEIIQLTEALSIARSLGIKEDMFMRRSLETTNSYDIGMDYLRGTETLSAQIEALKKRTSEDPYTPGLRELQEKYDAISRSTVDPTRILVARIDQPALVPDKPISPMKGLVFVLAGTSGLVLGVLSALVLGFIQRVQQKS